ncbi:MAG: T9SS type A sorting domain-containing protein, partial [Bacteroidetes bacterium]|nr:T9SS type A sorting domain-containing protein [Bacteroidota bacterium]
FNNSFNIGVQDLNYSSGSRGNWSNKDDKYLGLRFNISGNTHYGWARLTVSVAGSTWVIKDYAYNTIPDEPITAGQMTLGIDDNVFSGVKIVALNKSVALYNLPQQTDYRLFSLTGQSVLNGKISNTTHVIEANTLSSGIYVIELKDKISNAVIRKKIVL